MTSAEDAKLMALMREDAPPAHDPMFRLSVLERRERRQFRRRVALLFAMVSIVVLTVLIAARAVGTPVLESAGISLFGVVLVTLGVAPWRWIGRIIQRFLMLRKGLA